MTNLRPRFSQTMASIETLMDLKGTSVRVLDNTLTPRDYRRVFEDFFAGHRVVAVDTEGFRDPNLISIIQVASASGVVVQTIDTELPSMFKLLLEDETVIKVFFSAADDIQRLQIGLDCKVAPVIDLQALTVSEFDVRAHSLVDALNRLGAGGSYGILTKDSFGKRGFTKYNPTELLSAPGFIKYAASDAWATLCGFETWLARVCRQARIDPTSYRAYESVYSTIDDIRDKRTRSRYQPLRNSTLIRKIDLLRHLEADAVVY